VPERIELPGLLRVVRNTHQALITVGGYDGRVAEQLRAAGAESVEALDLSLEEIFVEAVQGQGGRA
jgi:hypothetical protein